jgi:hypothetical protein
MRVLLFTYLLIGISGFSQLNVFSGIKKNKHPNLQENILGTGELREEMVFNLYSN